MAAADIEITRVDADGLRRSLRAFQTPDTLRSAFEFGLTVVLFAATWAAMAIALSYELGWLYALLIPPAAGLLLRLFMVQHDCGHGSFFATRKANDWVGRVVGVLTMTDYEHWRRSHAIHHATSGNLDRRGVGDIDTLTVDEYRALPGLKRLAYRLYRNPLVMFGIGPSYVFLLQGRLPVGFMRSGRALWVSTMTTNAAILVLAALLAWAVGPATFFMIQLPIVVLAATIGVWLFFVQHQFDRTHWSKNDEWNASEAALYGSSYYHMPAPLSWLTANIGIHHVHHLSSRIPFYRLPEVLREFPELRDIGRLTLWESLKCVPLTLWDETSQRLISFREFYASSRAARPA
ncbi:fatty acid desaturase [Chenggangzhangella methanolivorans]|uniref:Fatty acid desaturase n=1 Tax=Chenggangzhangella methanolivorans TaxID=1437009 RepID=A0A9E6UG65_9HYPH|nr:fatty acid desaturase [Chenggangzhangella methanolivorans]QZN98427.1 fatty acid desaturase [Chenggangzhangella methanolivorans]